MSTTSSRRTALLSAVVLGGALAVIGLRTVASTPPGEDPSLWAEVPPAPEATPELAAQTMDRLQLFRAGTSGPRLSLGSDEVTALLRHGLPGVLPVGLIDPVVTFEGDRVRVDARLVPADFVGRAPLASVLGALPDTIRVDLRGRLNGGGDYLSFEVDEAHAGPVPLPATVVAAIASELGESSGARMASTGGEPAFGIRRPTGFAAVDVRNGRLELRRYEPMIDRAVDGSDDP